MKAPVALAMGAFYVNSQYNKKGNNETLTIDMDSPIGFWGNS